MCDSESIQLDLLNPLFYITFTLFLRYYTYKLPFKDVIQAVLLFGVDTCVVTPCMGKALGGFQIQVARRMTVHLPRRTTDRNWRCTSAVAARDEAGFLTM